MRSAAQSPVQAPVGLSEVDIAGAGIANTASRREDIDSSKLASLAVISAYAWSISHLNDFFPHTRLLQWPRTPFADAVAVWGDGTGAKSVERLARLLGRPVLKLEDGFLRSVGLAKNGTPPLSIVVDDLGLYLDASRPSRLEVLVKQSASPAWVAAGAEARTHVVKNRLSKYNLPAQPQTPNAPKGSKTRIVLVDQVRGDNSIRGALASEASFDAMRADAMTRDATIIVRQHPDVGAGHRRGHLEPEHGWLVSGSGDSHDILDVADEVWTVSSQLGFEALLRGITVVTYGMSFYSGYGLTEDRASGGKAEAARERRATPSVDLDQFVAAALLRYPRYVDPGSGRSLSFQDAVDLLIEMRSRSKSP